VPRRSFLVVSSANQRSTRLSHEETGRGEVHDETWDGLSANALPQVFCEWRRLSKTR